MKKQLNIKLIAFLLLELAMLSILTGCVKARIAVNVETDGSGTVGIALGMTQEVKTLIASQSEEPFQYLTQSWSESSYRPQDVKISKWTEGDYEWLQGEVVFKDLDDLNTRLSQIEYIKKFSISRQPGIFRDRFILEAQFKPLLDYTPDSDFSDLFDIDPAAFIEVQMTVRLPGDVIETNGIFDGNNSQKMTWRIGSKQAITLHAVSETWNWFNIGIIGGSAIVITVAIGGMIFLATSSIPRRKKDKTPSGAKQDKNRNKSPLSSPVNNAVIASNCATTPDLVKTKTADQMGLQNYQPQHIINLLSIIGTRSLLQEVNHYLLKDIGTISELPDELVLEWSLMSDLSEIQKIHIRLIDHNHAAINDQIFPATYEGVKRGISTSIQRLKRPVPT